MDPVQHCSCWPVVWRTLMFFGMAAIAVYVFGTGDPAIMMAR